MSHVKVINKNEAYVKVECDPGIGLELRDHFTFEVPGARFSPQYRNKLWDGKIRLYNANTGHIFRGLVSRIESFCASNDYTFEYDSPQEEFSLLEAKQFVDEIGLPEKYIPRDYQLDAFVHAIRSRRALLLSPTASGKSLILHLIIQKILKSCTKVLVIVPTINLVNQLGSDFADYGLDIDQYVHKIHGGLDKHTDKPITISTWQSIVDLPSKYFHEFDAVLGDEAHLYKAKSLTSIMSALINTKYRIGVTGTLDDTKTHKLALEGLFGPVHQVTTTKTLIDNKTLADFEVKCLLLNHNDSVCQALKKADYSTEIKYLIKSEARNNFITNLALSLQGNTLILFQFIEHGILLQNIIKTKDPSKKIFFIYGKTDADIREETRKIIETCSDSIIIASSGVFSTGVNIVNLNSVIFASPSKSRIRVLQSIGRVLRRSFTKTNSVLFDIADNLSYKKHQNFTYKHFAVRLNFYVEEKFKFKLYKINLKGN